METDIISKYAIINRRIELKTFISSDVLEGNKTNAKHFKHLGSLPVDPGSLVKILRLFRDNNKTCIVQVLDFVHHDFIFENLYECPLSNLMKVREDIWPYVISIQPERRLRFNNSKEQCQWLTYLKVNDLVSVSGELFGKGGVRFDCIIRYIGPVQELNPVGYFFGLELLHLDYGLSPQSDEIPFSIKYLQCDPSLSIFTTADWVSPIPNEVKKKFSAKQLINETIEKVYTALVPTNAEYLTFNTKGINQRKDRKSKVKTPTAQFYDQPSSTEISTVMEKKSIDKIFPIMSSENEDFKDSVKNFGKNVERQHGNQLSEDYSQINGILKHKKALNCNSECGITKQPTITNLSDKDIIVIDKADIKELTKEEANIIVVDKPITDSIDLADILGNNWPKHVGEAASILNGNKNVLEYSTDKRLTSEINPDISINKHDALEKTKKLECNLSGSGIVESYQLHEVPGTRLSVGSLVEISAYESIDDLFGVIRWIGVPPGQTDIMVGVELEDEPVNKDLLVFTTNGSFNNIRLFECQEGRAIFVPPDKCFQDRRFLEVDGAGVISKATNSSQIDASLFGHIECAPVSGVMAPVRVCNIDELEDICGKFKGIQGHHNSCYLDATLFSMFTFTSVFDSLLYRSSGPDDIIHYQEVQKVLREEIVNPLRKNTFVRADRVMKLRKLLDQLSSVSGLTSEEKDPEEFLNSLLAQIMHVDPFLKLNSGQDSYFYQLFVEKDERLTFPTVQQLFEQSFHSSDIKLKEVPPCLIIQMPRFGKSFKMYPRILPSQVLDVTDIIEDSPRQCSVCGKLAEYECRECFGNLQGGAGLECTSFCEKCLNTVHLHSKRNSHTSRKLSVPKDFKIMADHITVPRLYMELFAVVCIETSHYVAFVKAGSGPDAPWCFFDSMADRKGERNGYNIPEMVTVPELLQWLSDEGAKVVNESSTNDKALPEHAKRLFCDAYMCMYQSCDVMMYR